MQNLKQNHRSEIGKQQSLMHALLLHYSELFLHDIYTATLEAKVEYMSELLESTKV